MRGIVNTTGKNMFMQKGLVNLQRMIVLYVLSVIR